MNLTTKYLEDKNGNKYAPVTVPAAVRWANGDDLDDKLSGLLSALNTQTAYTSKGSATKVPQITTNSLGQVTGITEVTINLPTVNNSTITLQANGSTVDTFDTNASSAKTINLGNILTSTTSGLKIEVVSALPASPDSNTIYIVQ